MAAAAIGSVVAIVIIVFEVAADAVRFHDVVPGVVTMTVVTAQFCVFAREREVGVFGVIEAGIGP